MPRRLAPLLLALAACSEPAAVHKAPTDRFAWPATLAVMARQSGGQPGQAPEALLVASGNFDLNYDGPDGGTILSVDPREVADGGSAAPGGGLPLVKFGAGANVGSYAGQLVVVDATTCPVATGVPVPAPEVLLPTRFAGELWRVPVGSDGQVDPCTTAGCTPPLDPRLKDPFALGLACNPDSHRRSAFMGFLRLTELASNTLAGCLAQLDLDAPTTPARIITVGTSTLVGMAHDAETDQLLVVGQQLNAAPVYILDLTPCPDGLAACPTPAIGGADLTAQLRGLELQSVALSNVQAGLKRRAYVTARVYDPDLAALLGARPSIDVAGLLLVLDLEPGLTGKPSLNILHAVHVGLGASQLQVLPARAPAAGVPRRDVVVVSSITDGQVTVYDDELGDVVRVIPVDATTGAPEAGRGAYGLASVRLQGDPRGDVARVFVAATREQVIGLVDVPLDDPSASEVVRRDGLPVRIGGLQ